MRLPSALSLAFLLSIAPALRAAPGDVWTVAPSGADFTQIQPAVDAAADGDLILVKPGSYGPFAIFDRSLTVVAEVPGTVSVAGTVRVANLAASRSVNLIHLSATAADQSALRLVDNFGAVRVRGGAWKAAPALGSGSDEAAIFVVGCEDVALRECAVAGGHGAQFKAGGAGLFARNSSVALYASTVKGGIGSVGIDGEAGGPGYPGGAGARVQSGFLFAAGGSIQGGKGGKGGDAGTILQDGGNGGSGGDGLQVLGDDGSPNTGFAQVELVAVTLAGGAGGAGGFAGGQPGAPGDPLEVTGLASVQTYGATPRHLVGDGLWIMGQPEQVTFSGEPGEKVYLVASSKPQFLWLPGKLGVLLVGGFPLLKYVGQCDAAGLLTRTVLPPVLTPGTEGRVLHWQAWMQAPTGAAVLTDPLTTALIAPGF